MPWLIERRLNEDENPGLYPPGGHAWVRLDADKDHRAFYCSGNPHEALRFDNKASAAALIEFLIYWGFGEANLLEATEHVFYENEK